MKRFDSELDERFDAAEELVPRSSPTQRHTPAALDRDELADELVRRMTPVEAGDLTDRLAQLQSTDPELYATALSALQPILGNAAVSALDARVREVSGPRSKVGSGGPRARHCWYSRRSRHFAVAAEGAAGGSGGGRQ